jgi:hypothetical protein
MPRIKITTTIDEELLKIAEKKAHEKKLRGINGIIELALELYYAKNDAQIWEKSLISGCVERIILFPSKLVTESIRNRIERLDFNKSDFSEQNLKTKGWSKI